MTGPVLALLPSPLLGPAVWRPVADLLRRGGRPVVVPEPAASGPATPEDVLAWYVDAVPAGVDLVLVPHSNAGLFVPGVVVRRRVVAAVFVDAGLPPGTGAVPLAPLALLDQLEKKADDDGLLPPWTHWWPEAEVAGLFPGDRERRDVEAEQHRLPLSYFASSVDVPVGWDTNLAGAYLAFGGTYADERAAAERRRWPTRAVAGQHLHMLKEPAAVTEEIVRLLAVLGLPVGP